jgi:ABC-type transporter Mla MlaB component
MKDAKRESTQIVPSDTSGSKDSASISGDLTFNRVAALYQQAQSLLGPDSSIRQLDLAEVQAVDSSGLALLLEWQAAAKRRGSFLKITHAPADLLSLAKLCEAQELLQLAERN